MHAWRTHIYMIILSCLLLLLFLLLLLLLFFFIDGFTISVYLMVHSFNSREQNSLVQQILPFNRHSCTFFSASLSLFSFSLFLSFFHFHGFYHFSSSFRHIQTFISNLGVYTVTATFTWNETQYPLAITLSLISVFIAVASSLWCELTFWSDHTFDFQNASIILVTSLHFRFRAIKNMHAHSHSSIHLDMPKYTLTNEMNILDIQHMKFTHTQKLPIHKQIFTRTLAK